MRSSADHPEFENKLTRLKSVRPGGVVADARRPPTKVDLEDVAAHRRCGPAPRTGQLASRSTVWLVADADHHRCKLQMGRPGLRRWPSTAAAAGAGCFWSMRPRCANGTAT